MNTVNNPQNHDNNKFEDVWELHFIIIIIFSDFFYHKVMTTTRIFARNQNHLKRAEVESLRTSLASRTHFEVLGLGLEASSSRKLPCPRLEDSTIFGKVKILKTA